jgi:putative sigma-54 modulation protein
VTVKVDVKSRDIKLGDRLYEYVTSKSQKLDRYLNTIEEVIVELRHRESARDVNDRYSVQITLLGKGYTLRAEEKADDGAVAFDQTLERVKRQIERYKGKHYNNRGDGMSLAEDAFNQMETAIDYEPDEPAQIARRKKLTLIPMDELEAMEQAELLGFEDFFVFYNANTSNVNVLYKRHDGSYGLIETIVG